MHKNPINTLEQLIFDINHNSYELTRDDIDSIEWRIRKLQKYIKEVYSKRGKEL